MHLLLDVHVVDDRVKSFTGCPFYAGFSVVLLECCCRVVIPECCCRVVIPECCCRVVIPECCCRVVIPERCCRVVIPECCCRGSRQLPGYKMYTGFEDFLQINHDGLVKSPKRILHDTEQQQVTIIACLNPPFLIRPEQRVQLQLQPDRQPFGKDQFSKSWWCKLISDRRKQDWSELI